MSIQGRAWSERIIACDQSLTSNGSLWLGFPYTELYTMTLRLGFPYTELYTIAQFLDSGTCGWGSWSKSKAQHRWTFYMTGLWVTRWFLRIFGEYPMKQSESLFTLLVRVPPHLVLWLHCGCQRLHRLLFFFFFSFLSFLFFNFFFLLRTNWSGPYSTFFLLIFHLLLILTSSSAILFLRFSVGRAFILSLLSLWNNVNGNFNH